MPKKAYARPTYSSAQKHGSDFVDIWSYGMRHTHKKVVKTQAVGPSHCMIHENNSSPQSPIKWKGN